jgi:HK97 family phage major capsid protein
MKKRTTWKKQARNTKSLQNGSNFYVIKEDEEMNKIQELRNKRLETWEKAKTFLEDKRDEKGIVSAEDTAAYEKMEEEVVDLGKEIDRLERQRDMDMKLSEAISRPVVGNPVQDKEDKTGRGSDAYQRDFWNLMRKKNAPVTNALQVGTDSEGGYLAPDEFERTLVEALEEENILRQLAHVIQTSSGDRKIPVVATKGTASWVDEEAAIPESDPAFGQVSIGAYKLATMLKVSEELLNDSVFDLESYIAKEFGRRMGSKEEEAFLIGDGVGKPVGVFQTTGGGEVGVTAASDKAVTADELIDLFYSLLSI